jgi:hypothetical protein
MKATSCPLLVKTPLGAKCCALLESFLDPADQAGAKDFQRWLSVGGGSACRAFAEWQVKTHLPESGL